MNQHELYMRRCFDLARLGAGSVAPNPMVGAVLVHHNRIIGEGWHQRYGEAHAEVNAVNAVNVSDQFSIKSATLYISLEPCNIFGRTPPCTDLILAKKIPRVVISCLDLTPAVAGKGVALLRANGVEVITGVLEEDGKYLSRFRQNYVTKNRPYIFLKFAQTLNGKFGLPSEQVWITNAYTKRLVHKWRSEVDAILVGTNTARIDNPQLNNRLYFGKSPIRIIIDRRLELSKTLHIFDNHLQTIIVTETHDIQASTSNTTYLFIPFDTDFLKTLLTKLHEMGISTLMVEGGAQLLQSFIDAHCWDEARILVGKQMIEHGIDAPKIAGAILGKYKIAEDKLICYQNVYNR